MSRRCLHDGPPHAPAGAPAPRGHVVSSLRRHDDSSSDDDDDVIVNSSSRGAVMERRAGNSCRGTSTQHTVSLYPSLTDWLQSMNDGKLETNLPPRGRTDNLMQRTNNQLPMAASHLLTISNSGLLLATVYFA